MAKTVDRDLEAEATRLTALAERAQGGDEAALAALRKTLESAPGWWQQTGDLAWQAELAWLQTCAGTDELAKEAIRRKLRALRRELGGPQASPLERLLVSTVGLNWLVLYYAQSLLANRMGRAEGLSLEASTHMQERIDRAQRRYLASIKALATLRRLEQRGPLVAVGVAQLNVAAPSPQQPLPATGAVDPATSGAG